MLSKRTTENVVEGFQYPRQRELLALLLFTVTMSCFLKEKNAMKNRKSSRDKHAVLHPTGIPYMGPHKVSHEEIILMLLRSESIPFLCDLNASK